MHDGNAGDINEQSYSKYCITISKCDISMSGGSGSSAAPVVCSPPPETHLFPLPQLDTVVIDECEYTCMFNGGCEARYIGRFRSGPTMGSCPNPDFSPSDCKGIPDECNQDCHQIVDCQRLNFF